MDHGVVLALISGGCYALLEYVQEITLEKRPINYIVSDCKGLIRRTISVILAVYAATYFINKVLIPNPMLSSYFAPVKSKVVPAFAGEMDIGSISKGEI